MNLEKYTERARGFVQSAQSLALREGNQQFTPEHVLKVLLDDEEGLAAGLIDRAGGNSRQALTEVEAALAKLPKVEGSGAGQLYMAPRPACRFCSQASQLLRPSLTSPVRSSSAWLLTFPTRSGDQAPRMGERSPGSRTKSFRTCQSLRPRRAVGTLALSRSAMSPSVGIKTSAPWII